MKECGFKKYKSFFDSIMRTLQPLVVATVLTLVFCGCDTISPALYDMSAAGYSQMAHDSRNSPQQRSSFSAMSAIMANEGRRVHERDIANRMQPQINVNPSSQPTHSYSPSAYFATPEQLLTAAQQEFDRQNYQKVISLTTDVLRKYPGHIDSLRLRARSLNEVGMATQAIEDYTTILASTPTDLDALGNRGILYFNSNKLQQAYEDFLKALPLFEQTAPQSVGDHNVFLGSTCAQLGRVEEAERYLNRAVQDPRTNEYLRSRANQILMNMREMLDQGWQPAGNR